MNHDVIKDVQCQIRAGLINRDWARIYHLADTRFRNSVSVDELILKLSKIPLTWLIEGDESIANTEQFTLFMLGCCVYEMSEIESGKYRRITLVPSLETLPPKDKSDCIFCANAEK